MTYSQNAPANNIATARHNTFTKMVARGLRWRLRTMLLTFSVTILLLNHFYRRSIDERISREFEEVGYTLVRRPINSVPFIEQCLRIVDPTRSSRSITEIRKDRSAPIKLFHIDAKHFTKLSNLEVLEGDLDDFRPPDGIPPLPKLHTLTCYSDTPMLDYGWMQHCPRLTDVTICSMWFGDGELLQLSECKTIRRLSLQATMISSGECLAKITSLTELHISNGYHVTDRTIEGLEKHAGISKISLYECRQVTDSSLKSFGRMKELRFLSVPITKIEGVGLSQMRNITRLKLAVPLSNSSMEELLELDQLETLVFIARLDEFSTTPVCQELLRRGVAVFEEKF